MNDILLRVQLLLDKANREAVEISPTLLEEFGEACKHSLKRQFDGPRGKFTLRMSNVGRPRCQLQMEARNEPAEENGYNHRMKMLIGDLVEAAAIAILKTAGVNVEAQHTPVSLKVAGEVINGTLDVVIDGAVYDIKSASDYAFSNKFKVGFDALNSDDPFGYVAQGFGYSEAIGKRFGGWIAINKETGEWAVAEAPEGTAYEVARENSLAILTTNVKTIVTHAEFVRSYSDVPETFYGKETGNRILGLNCSWCNYKTSCWPEAVYKRQMDSKAKSPQMKWYTHIAPKDEE